MSVKKLCAAILCAVIGNFSTHAADEGTLTGVVAGKGETWLSVKSEGQEEPTMYMPHWRGGLPAEGGGLDKEILAQIKNTPVGSKVKLSWKNDERPRVVGLETLAAPEKPRAIEKAAPDVADAGDKRDKEMDGETAAERHARKQKEHAEINGEKGEKGEKMPPRKEIAEGERMPPRKEMEREREEKSGSYVAVVISKGEGFLDVKTSREAPVEKLVPRFTTKGESSIADRELQKTLRSVNVNQRYKIEWVQGDEHKRITKITPAP